MLTSGPKQRSVSKSKEETNNVDVVTVKNDAVNDLKKLTSLSLQQLQTGTSSLPRYADNQHQHQQQASDFSPLSQQIQLQEYVENLSVVPESVKGYCNTFNIDLNSVSVSKRTKEEVSSRSYPSLKKVFGDFTPFYVDVVTVTSKDSSNPIRNGFFHGNTGIVVLGSHSPHYVKVNEILHAFMNENYKELIARWDSEFFPGEKNISLFDDITIVNDNYTYQSVGEFWSDAISGMADPDFGRHRLYELFFKQENESEDQRVQRLSNILDGISTQMPSYLFTFLVHNELYKKYGEGLTAVQLADALKRIAINLKKRYNQQILSR